jgi:hypothetical protein
MNRIQILAAVLIVAALGGWLARGGGPDTRVETAGEATGAVTDVAQDVADTAGDAVETATGAVEDAADGSAQPSGGSDAAQQETDAAQQETEAAQQETEAVLSDAQERVGQDDGPPPGAVGSGSAAEGADGAPQPNRAAETGGETPGDGVGTSDETVVGDTAGEGDAAAAEPETPGAASDSGDAEAAESPLADVPAVGGDDWSDAAGADGDPGDQQPAGGTMRATDWTAESLAVERLARMVASSDLSEARKDELHALLDQVRDDPAMLDGAIQEVRGAMDAAE